MVSNLALFPLQSVVFPGENLRLHIFETRYKQLIEDCETTGITFGIPTVIDSKMEYGTEMELIRIVENYSSGSKDIICKGLRVFRIKKFNQEKSGKIYANGQVEFLDDIEATDDTHKLQQEQFLALLAELYKQLEVPPPITDLSCFTSYTFAHKMGLSQHQEYTLLKIPSENMRLEFLINHLQITIPIIQEMNHTKFVIELNGQFKKYDPLDFEDFNLN